MVQKRTPVKGKSSTTNKDSHPILWMQIGFLKKLLKVRNARIAPNDELARILIEQYLLRYKIGAKVADDPEKVRRNARWNMRKLAPWYDVDSFAWEGRDDIDLLNGLALGNAIGLTAWEHYLCKPWRGSVSIDPIDKDVRVAQYEAIDHRYNQEDSAAKRNEKLKEYRARVRAARERDVRRYRAEGLDHDDIALIFDIERKEHPSAPGIVTWTGKMVAAFDPNRDTPEHKRELTAKRQRKQRRKDDDVTNREQMAYAMDSLRDEIRVITTTKAWVCAPSHVI